MAALSIKPSYPVYLGTDGLPLENGYIYIGTAGLAAITNQISVYWDSSLSVPAAQPIRTTGGYPSNSGSPGMLYMNGTDYSILVADKNNVAIYSALNVTEASAGVAANTAAIATNTADIATNTADIATNVTAIGLNTSKLAGIEAGADVTDATNVDAAGAVMNSDTTTAAMSFVIDEDNMASDSATKVPTQHSVKAYVDSSVIGAPEYVIAQNAHTTNTGASSIVIDATLVLPSGKTWEWVKIVFIEQPGISTTTGVITLINIDGTDDTATFAKASPAIFTDSDSNSPLTTIAEGVPTVNNQDITVQMTLATSSYNATRRQGYVIGIAR